MPGTGLSRRSIPVLAAKAVRFAHAMRAQAVRKDFFKAFLVTRKPLCKEKRSDPVVRAGSC